MGFNEFLKLLVGDRTPSLIDMHIAFSNVATIYIEESLNLVNQATLAKSDTAQVLAQADIIFGAWVHEIDSLKSAILTVSAKERTPG